MFDEIQLNIWIRNGEKVCRSGTSRQELSNENLLAKFGVDTLLFENRTTSDSDSDTAENRPLKVRQKVAKS